MRNTWSTGSSQYYRWSRLKLDRMSGDGGVSLGLTWTHLVSLGLTCTHLVWLGFTWTWTLLVSLGLTWPPLVSLDLTGTLLVSQGLTWSHLVLHGLTRSHLDSEFNYPTTLPQVKRERRPADLLNVISTWNPDHAHARTNQTQHKFPGWSHSPNLQCLCGWLTQPYAKSSF